MIVHLLVAVEDVIDKIRVGTWFVIVVDPPASVGAHIHV